MMRILHVCAEFFPLLKTGGLADVTGALPVAQSKLALDVRLLLPAFPAIRQGFTEGALHLVAQRDTFAGTVSILYGDYHGIGVYLIDAPHLYNRAGSPYHDQYLQAYHDNLWRFALLGYIACELACGLDSYWRAEIVHAHDWHAGLAAAYLAARNYPARVVFTIHNLYYQGLFTPCSMAALWLPDWCYSMHGLEFNGQISLLKAGLYYANCITTVSPTYATEITQPPQGYGMEGLLQQRQQEGRLTGILNGVDHNIWNPASDPDITSQYSQKSLQKKQLNKQQLQTTLGLKKNSSALLFVVISRLTPQKGLDLLLPVLPELLRRGGQLALLGSGESYLQQGLLAAAAAHPDQISVTIGYNEPLSHQLIAAGDVVIVPSRFEPCGLTQLYGLKYGTLPLVRYTGGLADTVTDCSLENLAENKATGMVFINADPQSLLQAVKRAFVLWSRPDLWRHVQQQTMNQDFSWQLAARSYRELYQQLT